MTLPLHPIFSHAWAQACAAALNGREGYRAAAAGWEGSVLLVMANGADAPARAVFLDLWHGECRLAREATAEDLNLARYALSGTVAAWRQVLTGQVAPLLALMTGRLQLTRGALADLVPYAGAARELVAALALVPTEFPTA